MMNQMPPILRRNATGADVERLQRDLSKLGYNLVFSGMFDEDTQKAVMQFQQDQNLTVDGVVGQQTGQKLGASLR